MCEEVIHLQAIAHFGTQKVVPACWTTRVVVMDGEIEEVFGSGHLGGEPVNVTALPTVVTCEACRKLIH